MKAKRSKPAVAAAYIHIKIHICTHTLIKAKRSKPAVAAAAGGTSADPKKAAIVAKMKALQSQVP